MKIPYKYQIGQKVIIDNDNNYASHWGRDKYLTPLVGKEAIIIERGFELEVLDNKFYTRFGLQKPNFQDKYHLNIYYYIDIDPVLESLKN